MASALSSCLNPVTDWDLEVQAEIHALPHVTVVTLFVPAAEDTRMQTELSHWPKAFIFTVSPSQRKR